MKERKPASFWICLGVVLALTVLLTTWTSLRLYPGLVNAPVPVGQERVYTLLVQQRVNLGEVCIYLAAFYWTFLLECLHWGLDRWQPV